MPDDPTASKTRRYHVALSFAGEDRQYVESVASELVQAGVDVFYDRYEEASLWGKNLYDHLRHIYSEAAYFTIIFVSAHYAQKLWTNHERESAQSRAFGERREYILPARFDDTKVPGLLETTGYVDLRRKTPKEFAELVIEKLRQSSIDLKGDPIRPPGLQKLITNSIGMKLVLIPAGEFLMGSPDEDKDAWADEKPRHRVRITRPFYLGATEVTQEQFQKVMGRNPSWFSAEGGGKDRVAGQDTSRHPVEEVSWFDAIEFCNRLSQRESLPPYYQSKGQLVHITGGEGYRLPTEAEWEYACRAGRRTRYSFGDDEASLSEVAWYDKNSGIKTHTVGQKRPNGFGLYDMHGNVWEWCWDWYSGGCYEALPREDPLGPSSCNFVSRVYRGGGWNNYPRFLRSAKRDAQTPNSGHFHLGFRVARGPVRPLSG